jgi:hypothetical protein
VLFCLDPALLIHSDHWTGMYKVLLHDDHVVLLLCL